MSELEPVTVTITADTSKFEEAMGGAAERVRLLGEAYEALMRAVREAADEMEETMRQVNEVMAMTAEDVQQLRDQS